MDVTETTSTRRVVEVDGYEFYVEELAQPLGWLRRGAIEDELVNTPVLTRMKAAGLVEKKTTGGFMSMSDDDPVTKWEPVGDKCRDLFERLNEPYARFRPAVESNQRFGMWDESEDDRARQKAHHAMARLERRNPDVEFVLDEEERDCLVSLDSHTQE